MTVQHWLPWRASCNCASSSNSITQVITLTLIRTSMKLSSFCINFSHFAHLAQFADISQLYLLEKNVRNPVLVTVQVSFGCFILYIFFYLFTDTLKETWWEVSFQDFLVLCCYAPKQTGSLCVLISLQTHFAGYKINVGDLTLFNKADAEAT